MIIHPDSLHHKADASPFNKDLADSTRLASTALVNDGVYHPGLAPATRTVVIALRQLQINSWSLLRLPITIDRNSKIWLMLRQDSKVRNYGRNRNIARI